ncbi:MAG: hypothetical protein N2Z67_07735 [Acetobacteraceae bacterium]|nr:hypothetical protein [Acetobacteraceae bacterium]
MSLIAPNGGTAGLALLLRDSIAGHSPREALLLSLSGPAAPAGRLRRRLLAEALAPLRGSRRVRLFDLPGGDLVAIAPPPAPELDVAAEALAAILEDPAAVRRLDLPAGAPALLAAMERAMGLAAAALPAAAPAGAPPLDEAGLAALERGLAQADLSPFLRCQTVCRIAPGTPPEPCWEDRRVPEAPLVAALTGQDAAAAPELLRRLRRTLDRRMLAALARPECVAEARPVLLPLLPESLASDAFQRVEAAWPRRSRKAVLLSLAVADMLATPDAAAGALATAREGGWRVVLEAAGPEELRLAPARALGIGLVRVPFSPALAADPGALGAAGAEVVLAAADRAAAIAWGWQHGVGLFQGRLVEKRRG